VILGFVTNRLNVSVTGMEAGSGTHYVPKWTEVMITLSLIALGFAIFRYAVKCLPIFPAERAAQPQAFAAPVTTGDD
jgi:Ni/Fe-hydrogenase subunit HybB-like protein